LGKSPFNHRISRKNNPKKIIYAYGYHHGKSRRVYGFFNKKLEERVMRNGRRKYSAIFLAMCMVVTAMIAMVPTVSAEPITTSGGDLDLVQGWGMSAEGVYAWEPFGGPYYLGMDDYDIWFMLHNNRGAGITEVYVNVTDTGPLDFYSAASANNPQDIAANSDAPLYYQWMFNTSTSATMGSHNLVLRIDYTDTVGTRKFIQWGVEVIITSRATVNVIDTLFAGDEFREIDVNLNPGPALDNVFLNITAPDADFTWGSPTDPGDATTAVGWDPGVVPAGGQDFPYRIYVTADKDPGVYSGAYTIDYTVGGTRCYETGEETDFYVYFTPIVTATGTAIIQQGTTSADISVTFENTGNIDLSQVEVKIADQSLAYLIIPDDYYEGAGTVITDQWTPIGDLNKDAPGNTFDAVLRVGFDSTIPPGEHKILFDWQCYYSDSAELRTQTRVVDVDADWYNGPAPNPPYEERVAGIRTMDADDFEFNVHTGAFVFIDVTPAAELNIDALYDANDQPGFFTTQNIRLDRDLIDFRVRIELTNNEEYNLDDVVLKLETSTTSPFENPVDTASGWSEEVEIADLNSGWTEYPVFQVNLRDGAQAGIYELQMNLTGVKESLREDVAGTMYVRITIDTIPAIVTVSTVVGVPEIVPGEPFDLTVTLTNHGDDTARDIWLLLDGDWYNNDFEIVDDFVDAIKFGSDFEYDNRTSGIKLEQLSIDDVADIVDLHIYLERTLSTPQAKVWTLYVPELAPGGSEDITFQMITDKYMITGMPYTLYLYWDWIDSNGVSDWDDTQITVRTDDAGEEYTPPSEEEDFDPAVVLYSVIFLIIAFIIFLIGFALGGKGGRPAGGRIEEKPYEPFEEEYKPPEPSEEEIAPPPPEEKPPE